MSNEPQQQTNNDTPKPESLLDKAIKYKEPLVATITFLGSSSGIAALAWFFLKAYWMLAVNIFLFIFPIALLIYLFFRELPPTDSKSFFKGIGIHLHNNKKPYYIFSIVSCIPLSLCAYFYTFPVGKENAKRVKILIGSSTKHSIFPNDFKNWTKGVILEIFPKSKYQDKVLISYSNSTTKKIEEANSEFAGTIIWEDEIPGASQSQIQIYKIGSLSSFSPDAQPDDIHKSKSQDKNDAYYAIKTFLQRAFIISESKKYDTIFNAAWKIIREEKSQKNAKTCENAFAEINNELKLSIDKEYKNCSEWNNFIEEVNQINIVEYNILYIFFKASVVMQSECNNSDEKKLKEDIQSSFQKIAAIRYGGDSDFEKQEYEKRKQYSEDLMKDYIVCGKEKKDVVEFSGQVAKYILGQFNKGVDDDYQESVGKKINTDMEKNPKQAVKEIATEYENKKKENETKDINKNSFNSANVKEEYSLFILASTIAIRGNDKNYAQKAIGHAGNLIDGVKTLDKKDEARRYFEEREIHTKLYGTLDSLNEKFGLDRKHMIILKTNFPIDEKKIKENKDKYVVQHTIVKQKPLQKEKDGKKEKD